MSAERQAENGINVPVPPNPIDNRLDDEMDDFEIFAHGFLERVSRLSPPMKESFRSMFRAILQRYYFANFDALPPRRPPALPRYSPHG